MDRNLIGYSPWSPKESDTTEQLTQHTDIHISWCESTSLVAKVAHEIYPSLPKRYSSYILLQNLVRENKTESSSGFKSIHNIKLNCDRSSRPKKCYFFRAINNFQHCRLDKPFFGLWFILFVFKIAVKIWFCILRRDFDLCNGQFNNFLKHKLYTQCS